MARVLVTDSLFIFDEHVRLLEDAGHMVCRVDRPDLSESELVDLVGEVEGYILGGIELVTDSVIEAAVALKAIVFTGADWRNFIPGHELATQRSIAIASTPAANAVAVAEYTVAIMLLMQRRLIELGNTGSQKFLETGSLEEATVGIVGYGAIGERVARTVLSLGAGQVLVASRTQRSDFGDPRIMMTSVDKVFSESDVVSLHASKEAGSGYVGHDLLSLMKPNALLVDASFDSAVDRDALFDALSSGRIRAALDHALDDRFGTIGPDIVFNSNAHTAYNTRQANKRASDMATASMINLLAGEPDPYQVNG